MNGNIQIVDGDDVFIPLDYSLHVQDHMYLPVLNALRVVLRGNDEYREICHKIEMTNVMDRQQAPEITTIGGSSFF